MRTILSNADAILEARSRAQAGDPALIPAAARILNRAEQHLGLRSLTVTDKTVLAPSADAHDYMSMSSYHWPNPGTPNGLPYVRRDGHINPEAVQTDLGRFQKLAPAVHHLAWAYFLSGDERFAGKSSELIRTWFLDPATKMNPHLRYGGHIPGVVDGRSYGLTDVKSIRFILDGIGFLRSSPAWTDADEREMQAWVSAYLDWLLTSRFGKKEAEAPNNHGTWYDAQVLACALFVQDRRAVELVAQSLKGRIATQFTPEGSQPEEMKRTRALQYCMMNLHAFFENASMLSNAGIDLWQFEVEGKSLKNAAGWLASYALGHKKLPSEEVVKATPVSYLSVFRRAAIAWEDWRFEAVIYMIDAAAAEQDLLQLQYPLRLDFSPRASSRQRP